MSEGIIINSLQDFISKFDELEFSGDFYYRGETQDFGETKNLASGYRWIKEKSKVFDDLLWLRKDYYREIGHTLTEKETENFISYSQHHGLPTELLDITSNSLVALYFACEHDFEKDGYVYLFEDSPRSKENYDSTKFYDNIYHDLTKSLITPDVERQYLRFRWMRNIDDESLQKELWEQANFFVYLLFSESSRVASITYDAFQEYQRLRKLNNQLISFTLDMIDEDIKDAFGKDENYFMEYYKKLGDNNMDERLQLTQDFEISSSISLIGVDDSGWFPNLKLLLLKPSIIFDRMKNQQGNFIYQLCYEKGKKLIPQKIEPSLTFKIPASNKKKILSQLDRAGINRKFIYPDNDNIAKYHAENYSKSFWKKMHPFEDENPSLLQQMLEPLFDKMGDELFQTPKE